MLDHNLHEVGGDTPAELVSVSLVHHTPETGCLASTKLPASVDPSAGPMRAHELLSQYQDAVFTVVLTPSSGRGGVTPVHPTLSKHMLMEPYDKVLT